MTAPIPVVRVGILGVLTIVAYGSWFYGFGVLLDDMAEDFGSGIGVLTLGYTIAQVLTGVLGMWVGRSLDRHGVRRPFLVGAIVGPTLVVVSTLSSSPVVFSIVFGVGGGVVGATTFYHVTQTVVARLSEGREARAISQLTIWGAFSSPLLIPLTELLRATIGWRDTVRLSGAVVAVVLLVSAIFVDRRGTTRSDSPSSSSRQAIAHAWKVPEVRRLAVSSFASSFGTSIVMVLQIPAMVAAGLERSTAATMAGARGFAQLLGRLPLGRVLEIRPTRQVLVGAKLFVAIGALLLAVSGNVVIAALFVVIGGIGIGAVSPLDGIYGREVLPAHDLGTLMGSMHFVGGIMSGLGPLVGAFVVDVTGRTWSALVVAFVFVSGGAIALITPRRRAPIR